MFPITRQIHDKFFPLLSLLLRNSRGNEGQFLVNSFTPLNNTRTIKFSWRLCFCSTANRNYDNRRTAKNRTRNKVDRNPPIAAHKLDLLTPTFWASKDPLQWLTAVRNVTVGFVSNIRVHTGSPRIKSESLRKAAILIPSGQAQARSGTGAAILTGRSGTEKRSETLRNWNKMTRGDSHFSWLLSGSLRTTSSALWFLCSSPHTIWPCISYSKWPPLDIKKKKTKKKTKRTIWCEGSLRVHAFWNAQ